MKTAVKMSTSCDRPYRGELWLWPSGAGAGSLLTVPAGTSVAARTTNLDLRYDTIRFDSTV